MTLSVAFLKIGLDCPNFPLKSNDTNTITIITIITTKITIPLECIRSLIIVLRLHNKFLNSMNS